MYFESLLIDNTGPLVHLHHQFLKLGAERPRPTVFVGRNGSGKSIVLAHLAGAILDAQGQIFENPEVEQGKVYKVRHPGYVTYGKLYSRSQVQFDNGYTVSELQSVKPKSDFLPAEIPQNDLWAEIPPEDTSVYKSNIHEKIKEVRRSFLDQVILYYPPNRFEEPAWLNQLSLRNKANYHRTTRMVSMSDRQFINYAPLRENQDWLLDVIYDSHTVEQRITQSSLGGFGSFCATAQQVTRAGPASDLLDAVSAFLQILFEASGRVQYGVGARGWREISITIGNKTITENLFSLSTGQTILLNLFLTILRHHDLSIAPPAQLGDIKGIVIVDEVDLHLHTDLQFSILPQLIGLFPKIQFILTSHSPLFLMGMTQRFGDDGFEIIELPSGDRLTTERFSEFEAAYNHFKHTERFDRDIEVEVRSTAKMQVFVEGTIDVDYIKVAARLLDREDLLQELELLDGNGSGGLTNILKRYDTELAKALPHKVVLLYDCDTQKGKRQNGRLFVRTMAPQDTKIRSGIENLFPNETIARAIAANPRFVDIVAAHHKTLRGNVIPIAEKWSVNKDEKRNLCDWVIANGTADDFKNFSAVLDELEGILRQ